MKYLRMFGEMILYCGLTVVAGAMLVAFVWYAVSLAENTPDAAKSVYKTYQENFYLNVKQIGD